MLVGVRARLSLIDVAFLVCRRRGSNALVGLTCSGIWHAVARKGGIRRLVVAARGDRQLFGGPSWDGVFCGCLSLWLLVLH